jgi:hypothetical protein
MGSSRIWDRQPDEKLEWYNRFRKYYLPQGPGRKISKAWRLWYVETHKGIEDPAKVARNPNLYWHDRAKKWDWLKRAQAWDVEELRLMEERRLARIEKLEAQKSDLIGNFLTKVDAAIEKLKLDEVNLSQVTEAVKAVASEVRLEVGEPTPATRIELTGAKGGPIKTEDRSLIAERLMAFIEEARARKEREDAEK